MAEYEIWRRVETSGEGDADDFSWMVCRSGPLAHQTVSWFETPEEAKERYEKLTGRVVA